MDEPRSAEELVSLGLDLAVRLREGSDPDVGAAAVVDELRGQVPVAELRHLVVVLAALVDVDQRASQALEWCDGIPPTPRRPRRRGTPGPQPSAVCPSESAYRRHLRRGEPTDACGCRELMREVERDRRRRHPEWGRKGQR